MVEFPEQTYTLQGLPSLNLSGNQIKHTKKHSSTLYSSSTNNNACGGERASARAVSCPAHASDISVHRRSVIVFSHLGNFLRVHETLDSSCNITRHFRHFSPLAPQDNVLKAIKEALFGAYLKVLRVVFFSFLFCRVPPKTSITLTRTQVRRLWRVPFAWMLRKAL